MNNIIKTGDDYSPIAIIEKDEKVSVMQGTIHKLQYLHEIEELQQQTRQKIVFILPFCLASREKGYDAVGDEPIIAMQVEKELHIHRDQLLGFLPDENIELGDITPSISDEKFAQKVEEFKKEIYNGNICQGILSRRFDVQGEFTDDVILSIFKKLVSMRGQYMTYLFDTKDEVYLGASPERHLSVEDKKVTMNPIAGTMPKGSQEDFPERLVEFLGDKKEKDELGMVIDEELKMMLKIADNGVIEGPSLREAGAVIHTDVTMYGDIKKGITPMDALRETLYAPTLVGGPLESAFTQIKKYEQESRGYYGGAFGILDNDCLDSCIVIRSGVISRVDSTLSVRAGAGVVKDSEPEKEMEETIKKSAGFLGALQANGNNFDSYLSQLSDSEKRDIEGILSSREADLSPFYSHSNKGLDYSVEQIKGKRFVLLNNGDDFVYMLGLMIQKLGGITDIVKIADFDIGDKDKYDVVLLGPGYGDINNQQDDKMTKLLDITQKLIQSDSKVLGVCLGHQAINKVLGNRVEKQDEITQGEVHKIQMGEDKKTLAFYNSFSPVISSDNSSGVFANRSLYLEQSNICSTQAHPESVMSKDGFKMLEKMIVNVLTEQ